MNTPILYCNRESGHSYKVALALALMSVPFEQRAVDLNLPREQRNADFRRVALFGEVPVLVDEDGLAVCQSNAILDHLARRHRKLDGATPAAQTRVREWLAWEANRLAMSFPHLRFSRRFTQADPVLEAWWTQRMHADFDRLGLALRDHPFLVDDTPTIADISCCGYLWWAGQADVDLAPWPAIGAWLDRLRSQPRWQAPYDLLDSSQPIRLRNPYMTSSLPSFALPLVLAALLAGCGFHLRKEADLPASMKRVHIEIADTTSQLAKDLTKALPRSGAQVVDANGPDTAVLKISANSFSTDVLSVGGTARANEFAIRYHVEFEVQNAAGTAILPRQTIELSREFTFDATQALGVASETDLLSKELERDMVQTILRRLEALAHADNEMKP